MIATWLIILSGVLAILYGVVTANQVMAADPGNARMQEIAGAIAEGAQAYLKRQYTTIGIVGAVIFVGLWLLLSGVVATGFLVGAVLSGAAGFIGMNVSVRANVRTAQAATRSLAGGLDIAFKAGAVTGMLVAGLALLGVVVTYTVLTGPLGHGIGPDNVLDREVIDALVALGFGASLISIFARLGGGIFTKGADVGADLVGKVEAGIPEDDPRNPATIADNVGDNVGDCAGMAADLFETYAVTVVATMVLASIFFAGLPVLASMMIYPLAICGTCIVTSIAGTYFVRLGAGNSIMGALYKGLIVTGLLSIVGLAAATQFVTGWHALGVVSRPQRHRAAPLLLRHRRSDRHRAHRRHHRILHRDGQASGGVDRPGLRHGPRHQRHPGPRGVAGGHRAAGARDHRRHHLDLSAGAGLFGTAIAVTTMLGLAGMIVALDAFGPVTDNAGGIAEMAGLPKDVRQSTDALDAVGNTTKAVTKGYAIGSAGLGALVLFAAYSNDLTYFAAHGDTIPYFRDVGPVSFDLSNPYVVAGLIFGGMIPYLFGGIAMTAVGRAAGLRRRGGSAAVQGQARHHDGHRAPRLRPRRRHADPRRHPRDDRALAAAGAGALRGLFRRALPVGVEGVGLRGAGRHAARRHRQRALRGGVDDLGRRRLGQCQEELRGRFRGQARRAAHEGVRGPQGLGDRRHGRRPLQGHRRPRREPRHQDHQHRGAAAAGDPGALTRSPQRKGLGRTRGERLVRSSLSRGRSGAGGRDRGGTLAVLRGGVPGLV